MQCEIATLAACLPGDGEAYQNVEDVAADTARHCHVSVALSGHNDACHQIRYTRSCGQHGKTHNRLGDTADITEYRRPPHHRIWADKAVNAYGRTQTQQHVSVHPCYVRYECIDE